MRIICIPLFVFATISGSHVYAQTELSLIEAIDRSISVSAGITMARHDSATAALDYLKAKAARFPVLALKAQSFFLDELQSIDLPTGRIEIGSKENYQADFTVSVPLYTGGRMSNQIALTGKRSLAESSRLDAEITATAYRCRKAFLTLMMAKAVVKAASSSLDRIDIIRQDVQNLFLNGLADSLDILETELSREKGLNLLDNHESKLANASIVLAQLIGADLRVRISPTESIVPPKDPIYLENGYSSETTRPELEMFDYLISAANHLTRVELGAYLPMVSGFAGYSLGKPNKDMFHKSWNDYFSIGMSLSWEFNLGGKAAKAVGSAQQAAMAMRAAKRKLEDDLLLQKETALINLEFAYSSSLTSKKELDIASRKFRHARQKQDEGQISINRLLELEAELTAAERMYQAAIIQYYLAENEYLYAVGSAKIFGGIQ